MAHYSVHSEKGVYRELFVSSQSRENNGRGTVHFINRSACLDVIRKSFIQKC